MTEQEWLTSTDPQAMCAFVRSATTTVRTRWVGWKEARRFQISDRKWRLIYVACLARVVEVIPLPALQEGLARIETLADSDAPSAELGWDLASILREAGEVITRNAADLPSWLLMLPSWLSGTWAGLLSLPLASGGILPLAALVRAEAIMQQMLVDVRAGRRESEVAAETARQADLVRDILGNPFRGERVEPVWLSANDGAVLRLARGVAENGSYDELPILADALEDAGCSSEAMLGHCRGGRLHARGCWVLDLLLGRE